MILVDSSLWIEFLRGSTSLPPEEGLAFRFAHCPPVVQEVMQGVKPEGAVPRIQRDLLAFHSLCDPMPAEVYLEAASLYRMLRRKGVTVRSSNDCLIAVVAMRNRVPVWHKDRDFGLIARYTALEAFEPPSRTSGK
ncbi:MAG: PIN domain nuclease [Candidatus Solibacter usitatus]|nr:PIN domain nuclease [Candidatus Solibacter usitatus]